MKLTFIPRGRFIPNSVKIIGIFVGLCQAVVIGHELVHLAIFNYFNVPAKIKMGFLWGEIIPEFVPPDYTLRSAMYLAHSINEILLPITFLLVVLITVQIWRGLK